MKKYNIIVLMCSYDSVDVLKDVIQNIFKYNENVCVAINYDGEEDYSKLISEDVHIIKRKQKLEKFDTLIPLHIDLLDYIKEHNIVSDYVLLMASNQLFFKKNLYDFLKTYKAGYYNRGIALNFHVHGNLFRKYFTELESKSFKYQSNHDGMFFNYGLFCEMILFFDEYRDKIVGYHNEEYLYPAYLVKNVSEDEMVIFDEYNYWQTDMNQSHMSWYEFYYIARKTNCYMLKRIAKDMNDPIRKYLNNLTL